MFQSRIFPVLLATALGGSLLAQTVVRPPQYTDIWAGNNGSGVTFGTSTNRTQALYVSPLSRTLIRSVGLRRVASTAATAAFRVNMKVLLSSVSTTPANLSSTFSNNVGSDEATIFNGVLSVAAQPANTSADNFVKIPATTPFLFRGPNLLFEAQTGTFVSGTGFRIDRCFQRTTAGQARSFGQGCGSATISSTGGYLPGNTFTVTLSGAPANQPCIPIVGLTCARPYPQDLRTIGMNGCEILTQETLPQPLRLTDASGNASSGNVTVPNIPGIAGLGVAIQWLYGDPSATTPLRARATGGRLIHVGPITCTDRYLFSFSSATNATGSLLAGGPVLQIN